MRNKVIILLAIMLPLRELYSFFKGGVYFHFYPANPAYTESLQWYVSDIVTKLSVTLILFLWYKREEKRDKFFAKYLLFFTVFYTLDFLVYLLNHSHSGAWYLPVYLITFIYAVNLTKKRHNERTN